MTESANGSNIAREHAGGSYAPVNGLHLYYEIHGTGQPLVLIHGALGTTGMFARLLPALAANRQVIAVELQAHGHTADIDRPMSFEAMADDIGALIGHLGLGSADVLGYSMGGGVALQTAIRHPEVVRRLVLMSAPCKSDGWYAEDRAGMAAMSGELAKQWIGSPMHEAYASRAPRPEDWPALADKLGPMLGQDYDWSASVEALQTPTLIIIGDSDGVRPAAAVEMFGLLGGNKATGLFDPPRSSQLAILPGTTHFTVLERTDLLLPIIAPFLDAPAPDGNT